jgi:hypothetical protein
VTEEIRQSARWAGYFTGFQKPYVHFTPEEYRALAEHNGFRVLRIQTEDRAWDFQTREAFVAFGRATFIEWTWCLPESDWQASDSGLAEPFWGWQVASWVLPYPTTTPWLGS